MHRFDHVTDAATMPLARCLVCGTIGEMIVRFRRFGCFWECRSCSQYAVSASRVLAESDRRCELIGCFPSMPSLRNAEFEEDEASTQYDHRDGSDVHLPAAPCVTYTGVTLHAMGLNTVRVRIHVLLDLRVVALSCSGCSTCGFTPPFQQRCESSDVGLCMAEYVATVHFPEFLSKQLFRRVITKGDERDVTRERAWLCAPLLLISEMERAFADACLSTQGVVGGETIRFGAAGAAGAASHAQRGDQKGTAVVKLLFDGIPDALRNEAHSLLESCGTSILPSSLLDVRDSCISRVPGPLWGILKRHQREAVRRALALGGRALFADEMGVGKTLQALATLAALPDPFPCLVVCPAGLRPMWVELVETWLIGSLSCRSERFDDGERPLDLDDVSVIRGVDDMLASCSIATDQTGSYRRENEQKQIVVTSYKMLAALHESIERVSWRSVIIDESHSLRVNVEGCDADAIHTRVICRVGKKVPFCLMLSGTPSLTNPFGLYNQVDILRPGILGPTRLDFALDYCHIHFDPHLRVGACHRAVELNQLLLATVMIRRRKEDVLDNLPLKSRRVVRIPDDDAAEAPLFEDFRLPDGAHLPFATRYSREWRRRERGTCEYIRQLVTMCVEAHAKLVLFAHHLDLLHVLQTHVSATLGRLSSNGGGGLNQRAPALSLMYLDGSVDSETRAVRIRQFDEDEHCFVAVIGVTASAIGISLAAASTCVFVELPPDASWLQQAEDRLHRPDAANRLRHAVDVIILISPMSLFDAKTLASIEASMKTTREVTDGARSVDVQLDGHLDQDTLPPRRALAPRPLFAETARSVLPVLNPAIVANRDVLFRMSENTQRMFARLQLDDQRENRHLFSMSLDEALRLTHEATHEATAAGCGVALEAVRQIVALLTAHMSLFARRRWIMSKQWTSIDALRNGWCSSGHTTTDEPQPSPPRSKKRRYEPRWATESASDASPIPLQGPWMVWRISNSGNDRLTDVPGTLQRMETSMRSGWVPMCVGCGAVPLVHRFDVSPGCVVRLSCTAGCSSDANMFCSGVCRKRYHLSRRSSTIRAALRHADRGVCTHCGVDVQQLVAVIAAEPTLSSRRAKLELLHPQFLIDAPKHAEWFLRHPVEGHGWHADHVVAVRNGGGTCSVDNLQTLCVPCHVVKSRFENEGASPTASHDCRSLPTPLRHSVHEALRKMLAPPKSARRITPQLDDSQL